MKPRNETQRTPEKSDFGLKPEDYYLDEYGRVVFTEAHHLERGYCCKSGCRHCPYGFLKNSPRTEGFEEFKAP